MSDKINAQQEQELRENFNTLGNVFAAAGMVKPRGMQWKKIPLTVYTAAMNSLGEDEDYVPQSPVDSPYAHTVQELQALNQEVQSYPNDGGDDNYAVYGIHVDENGDLDAQWEHLMSV